MSNLNKIYNLLERIDTQYRDYTLLTESQESKSISAAKKLVMKKIGWDEQRADKFVRKELREQFSVLHHNSKAGKFILGLTRMFLDRQLSDGGTIQQLNRTLELVASDAHINEYDRNLNGLSAQELIDRFATARKEIGDKDREEVGTLELQENNDYTIVQIDDFEQARQYGKYTSWCVTHSENMLDSYTSGGIGQFYFCLKNGFENVPKEKGEGCPLDEYGLSMVAVSVDEDGRLSTCTCRWNHDKGGNDNIMDTKQISQLIGRNFYEVFKPNNKWKASLDDAIQRLKNGENPKDIFDRVTKFIPVFTEEIRNNYYLITLCNKMNILRDETILSDLWFDGIYISDDPFEIGSEHVRLNEKYNLIDINGKLLSPNLWFTSIGRFEDNLAKVTIERKFNFIDTNGNLLSPDLWFDDAFTFCDGLARVSLNHRWNFIQRDGKLLYDDFKFETLSDFHMGYASISTENGFNYINKNGDLLSDMWFDKCYSFNDKGYGYVVKDNLQNIIYTNGKLLSPNLWFDEMVILEDGMIIVELNRKCNFIKGENGELLSDMWFDGVYEFHCDMARVQIIEGGKRKYNYIDKNGNLLFKNEWLYGATDFKNGRAAVAPFDGGSYFINTNGDKIPYF